MNNKNAFLMKDLMLELSRTGNADYGEIMEKGSKLSYVLEHHDQAIFQLQTGRKAGQWQTKYFKNGHRITLIRKEKGDLIQFLYDHYQKGEAHNKTFETVYNETLTYKREIELKAYKTIEDYRNYFKRFMQPIKDMAISSLDEDTLRLWIVREVLPQRPRDEAFKRLLAYMNVAFRYARKKGYITSNPMEMIDYREYCKHCAHVRKKDEDEYFTLEEVEAIREYMLQNTTNPRALLALLNAEMGTRADEPVVIHWEDVQEDVICIHRQQIRNDETTPQTFEEVDYTKDTRCTDRQQRVFPITPRIREILEMARQLPGDSPYVIHDKDGRMISKDSYEQYLRRHCLKIGLTKTNNHCFRKGLNNNVLLPLGYSANDRAALLGHSVRTNEQHYSLRRADHTRRMGADIARFQAEQDGLKRTPKDAQMITQ